MSRITKNLWNREGTPVQQSLTTDPQDHRPWNMTRLMLGVVLDVRMSDSLANRSAQQRHDRLGFQHECDVLVLNDGSSSYMTMQKVVIPPRSPSGLDNYEEQLPRGCTGLASGGEYNQELHRIDPYDLDGDWCVIGFVGGLLDHPFVLSWWPHSRNPFDPATSGEGQEGNTLQQQGRYFRRVNGVEQVITTKGDVILSTTFSNSRLNPSGDPDRGRFPRHLDEDVGGSVRVYIKPSQSVELTFNMQEDGIGIRDAADPEMPQINPPQQAASSSGEHPNTYIHITKDTMDSKVPVDHRFTSGERILLESGESLEMTVGADLIADVEGDCTITATNVVTLEGNQILLGANAASPEAVLKGQSFQDWLLSFTVDSPFGPLPATQVYVQTLLAQVGSTKSFVE